LRSCRSRNPRAGLRPAPADPALVDRYIDAINGASRRVRMRLWSAYTLCRCSSHYRQRTADSGVRRGGGTASSPVPTPDHFLLRIPTPRQFAPLRCAERQGACAWAASLDGTPALESLDSTARKSLQAISISTTRESAAMASRAAQRAIR
jgi:hypothetical protein